MKLGKYWLIWGFLLSAPVVAEDLGSDLTDDVPNHFQEVSQPIESAVNITYTWGDFLMGKSF